MNFLNFQLHVFGTNIGLDKINNPQSISRSPLKTSPSHQLVFSAAQDDAFAVFQAIAAQVCGIFRIFR